MITRTAREMPRHAGSLLHGLGTRTVIHKWLREQMLYEAVLLYMLAASYDYSRDTQHKTKSNHKSELNA